MGNTCSDQIFNRLVDLVRDPSVLNASADSSQRKAYKYILYQGLEWDATNPNFDVVFAVTSLLFGLNADTVEKVEGEEIKTWMVPGVLLCNYMGITCVTLNATQNTGFPPNNNNKNDCTITIPQSRSYTNAANPPLAVPWIQVTDIIL